MRLPPAQSAMRREIVLPTPVADTTITISPTTTSSMAVFTMLRAPSTSASTMAVKPIGCGVSQLETNTAMIPPAAA